MKEENKEKQTSEEDEEIIDLGKCELEDKKGQSDIFLLSIIGEIEGHECLPSNTKTTKYEHVLPLLAKVETSTEYRGVLVLINSVGGDVESGLAIAEMIASLSKPVVTLVLGGSHSIAIPLAVSSDYSFIVPTGTMVIHPVRMNGLFIGTPQTYEYFKKIQDRIVYFIVHHCGIKEQRLLKLMMATTDLSKDVGSILVGRQAVEEHIIDQIGGIEDAISKLNEIIVDNQNKK